MSVGEWDKAIAAFTALDGYEDITKSYNESSMEVRMTPTAYASALGVFVNKRQI